MGRCAMDLRARVSLLGFPAAIEGRVWLERDRDDGSWRPCAAVERLSVGGVAVDLDAAEETHRAAAEALIEYAERDGLWDE